MKPIVLYGWEGAPYVTDVRRTLDELGLAHVLVNCAKGSGNRWVVKWVGGKPTVLVTTMFQEIIIYISRVYEYFLVKSWMNCESYLFCTYELILWLTGMTWPAGLGDCFKCPTSWIPTQQWRCLSRQRSPSTLSKPTHTRSTSIRRACCSCSWCCSSWRHFCMFYLRHGRNAEQLPGLEYVKFGKS